MSWPHRIARLLRRLAGRGRDAPRPASTSSARDPRPPRDAGAMQVRDLIRRIIASRQELQAWRDAAGRNVDDPRARFLLDFVAAHEAHIDATLAAYSSAKANALLDTWIPYAAHRPILDAIPDPGTIRPGMSVDAVVDATLHVDRALLDVYGRLASAPLLPPRVRELFASLRDLEASKERSLALALLDA